MEIEIEREANIVIPTPDDSNDVLGKTVITWEGSAYLWRGSTISIRNSRSKDPVLDGVKDYFKEHLGKGRLKRLKEMYFKIGSVPILLEGSSRYYMNGKAVSFNHMLSVLARVLIKSLWTDNKLELQRTLLKSLNISEDIRYVLENKMPYNFYKDFERVEVRLNVQQIGSDEYAIELSDGIWGTMKAKEINSFCSFFLHGKKTGKWKYCSPNKLFLDTVGRVPTHSEMELMIPFLEQNRTADLIEKRAKELVQDLAKQFSDKITLVYKKSGEKLDGMLVRGKGYDWFIRDNGATSGTQRVSTYVLGTKEDYASEDEEGEPIYNTVLTWKGPICIDNMSKDAPLGDQMCARAFATLNDILMLKRVSTIRGYLSGIDENKCRLDDKAFTGEIIDANRVDKFLQ